MGNKTRIHYVPDCPNESGNDTLALGTGDYEKVNCSDCIHEMYEAGIYSEHIDN